MKIKVLDKFIDKDSCCGCSACANICPQSAITMKENDEGFLYPHINLKECSKCNLCQKVCPINKEKSSKDFEPITFATMASNDIRVKSSSGGMFTILANYILEQNGFVCGASFDKSWKVKHIIIDNKKDLDKLRGSKYLQSDIGNIFKEIKNLLENNSKVLFTGTPCQVAGLKSFLGKDYKHLYLVDILCHGVPSPKIWIQYLKEQFKYNKIKGINFRDKHNSWIMYTQSITEGNKKIAMCEHYTMDFMKIFLSNICNRPSCNNCSFATSPRLSDITIGDFWGIKDLSEEMYDAYGTSMTVLNNKKGVDLFNQIKSNLKKYKEIQFENNKNKALTYKFTAFENRKAFFRLINSGKTVKESWEYCKKNSFDCAIIGYGMSDNFGSVLTYYALQQSINDLGFIAKTIPFRKSTLLSDINKSFVNEYFDLTDELTKDSDLSRLNLKTETFIVGADMVWFPPSFHKWSRNLHQLCLSFANSSKKKISYSSSFGTYNYTFFDEERLKMKYYLDQFDDISVREHEAILYMKKNFDIIPKCVLDSIFLVNKNKYMEIANKSDLKYNYPYICHYNLFEDIMPSIDIKLDEISKKLNMEIKTISKYNLNSMYDFLYTLANSNFILTQSYHGLCLAILLNKNFLLYNVGTVDSSRTENVLKMFGLENYFVSDHEKLIEKIDNYKSINWNNINKKIKKERIKSLDWLKRSLEKPKDFSKILPENAILKSMQDEILLLKEELKELKENN